MDIKSEVAATVWKVSVDVGQEVADGDVLMVLESMKMEIPVEALMAGTVAEIRVVAGAVVVDGEVLAVIEPS